jgi:hypothetical protein
MTEIIIICVSRLKRASFSSDSEFSGRGAAEAFENGRGEKALFGGRMNYEAKNILGKIINLFCIYFFKYICA